MCICTCELGKNYRIISPKVCPVYGPVETCFYTLIWLHIQWLKNHQWWKEQTKEQRIMCACICWYEFIEMCVRKYRLQHSWFSDKTIFSSKLKLSLTLFKSFVQVHYHTSGLVFYFPLVPVKLNFPTCGKESSHLFMQ